MALENQYAAVILDVMLPGLNGFDLLRELRRDSQVPVLMLTALGDEPDRIAGLEIGADDYLPKTYSTRELLARLRAVIRRSMVTARQRPGDQEAPVAVGGLYIDPGTHVATLDGQPLTLTPIEYDMLLALARSAGRVKSREQLLLEVAERDFEAFDRSIDVHISALRRKLGDDSKSPRYIETVRGAGYRMRLPESLA
jgi:DNA-binding response OmpR family regulator